ncbi:hypothetical protein MXAN_4848 [Myxococcus xanthus DK 1622]|uniref:Uncharacterized protein n=1 Tax=Myxococcus xanthus (strain DK1622) TaxID=246197 RepID=Q1D2W4_MYXXD|nr:hypothetical protein MXAN_4848 [Myxococcus xanthus DK 1622]
MSLFCGHSATGSKGAPGKCVRLLGMARAGKTSGGSLLNYILCPPKVRDSRACHIKQRNLHSSQNSHATHNSLAV